MGGFNGFYGNGLIVGGFNGFCGKNINCGDFINCGRLSSLLWVVLNAIYVPVLWIDRDATLAQVSLHCFALHDGVFLLGSNRCRGRDSSSMLLRLHID